MSLSDTEKTKDMMRRDVGEFAGRYVRGSAEVVSAMVQRELQYLFWKRGVRLVEQAEEFAREHRGEMTPDRIPQNLAVDILREGTMEEDDDIQDQYACLLVNAANEDAEVQVRRVHAAILSQLGPLEIKILDVLHSVRDERETINPITETGSVVTKVFPFFAIRGVN